MEKKRISLVELDGLKKQFKHERIYTVCQSAKCPNIGECFKNKTATFMILGHICSRNCAFCATKHGIPLPIDLQEPQKLANMIKKLKLHYVVITSVTRDDLDDCGAAHFKTVVNTLQKENPSLKIELLVPDFKGITKNLDIVLSTKFEVFAHNIETVPSLYKFRKQADYDRSLKILEYAKQKGFTTKTGIMLGLGESKEELLKLFKDIKKINCDILTIGQYLKPLKNNVDIIKEYSTEEFEYFQKKAQETGIKICISGRYIRSSYFADKTYNNLQNRIKLQKNV